jgi:hypothetical protein
MPSTKIDRQAGRARAAANDGLLARAAKRTNLAVAAVTSAAGDLDNAYGRDGNGLSGLAEVIRDESRRLASLAEDIESQRTLPAERNDAAK